MITSTRELVRLGLWERYKKRNSINDIYAERELLLTDEQLVLPVDECRKIGLL